MDENQTAANSFFPARPEPKPDVPKVDHLEEIAAIARTLHNVTPSGAQTASDKILMHVGAIRDPKAYDEKVAAEAKVEADAEKVRQKVRDERKAAAKAA